MHSSRTIMRACSCARQHGPDEQRDGSGAPVGAVDGGGDDPHVARVAEHVVLDLDGVEGG